MRKEGSKNNTPGFIPIIYLEILIFSFIYKLT
jgi:hypothetical protein